MPNERQSSGLADRLQPLLDFRSAWSSRLLEDFTVAKEDERRPKFDAVGAAQRLTSSVRDAYVPHIRVLFLQKLR